MGCFNRRTKEQLYNCNDRDMILNKNIGSVYSRGNEISRVYSYGKLVWEKKAEEEDDYDKYYNMPFTIKAVDDTVSIGLYDNYNSGYSDDDNAKYSINGGSWKTYKYSININKNDEVRIKSTSCKYILFGGLVDIYGNIMSLSYGDDFIGQTVFKFSYTQTDEAKLHLPMFGRVSSDFEWFYKDIRHAGNLILPATTLTSSCYEEMFAGCSNLITAPKLPATKLTNDCYMGMFSHCISLIQAPELPATILAKRCYWGMFLGCSNLNYVKCLATDMSADSCVYEFLGHEMSYYGTFVRADGVNWSDTNADIPNGWDIINVSDYVEDEDYFEGVCFTAEQDNSTIGLAKLSTNQTLEYKIVGSNWKNMTVDTIISLNNIGDKVYIRGELSGNNSTSNYTQFKMSGSISADGNITHIWSKNNLGAELKPYCGLRLFLDCKALIKAPEISNTRLANYCYYWMFRNSGITQMPKIPAQTLIEGCYDGMFEKCLSLTSMTYLPARTLAKYCYRAMFYNCSNLTETKGLDATTLPAYCYELMFYNCSKVNRIACSAKIKSATNCTNRWVEGVSETGTFRAINGNWKRGVSGIPENWTVEYI